jgi:hypothetical protein
MLSVMVLEEKHLMIQELEYLNLQTGQEESKSDNQKTLKSITVSFTL